ncbi:hypothetical protein EJ110_NYTH33959 [Nymphaea thermarum]|nr:hypothetical protein EJ110_NYTH33959 [Nymphaea thermarum]
MAIARHAMEVMAHARQIVSPTTKSERERNSIFDEHSITREVKRYGLNLDGPDRVDSAAFCCSDAQVKYSRCEDVRLLPADSVLLVKGFHEREASASSLRNGHHLPQRNRTPPQVTNSSGGQHLQGFLLPAHPPALFHLHAGRKHGSGSSSSSSGSQSNLASFVQRAPLFFFISTSDVPPFLFIVGPLPSGPQCGLACLSTFRRSPPCCVREKPAGASMRLSTKIGSVKPIGANSLLSWYARHGKIESARQVFDEMPERKTISWNAMISGYFQNGKVEEARHLFNTMLPAQRNTTTWNGMIAG